MVLEISDGHDEGLDSVVGLEGDAASKYYGVCGLHTKITWPEFGSLDGWGVDHELISVGIQRGCGLEPSDI